MSAARLTFVRVFGSRLSWSAILAGVFAALVVQILLTMLGLGVGLLALDQTTAASGMNWTAFVWWAISGIIAAFVGGMVAGGVDERDYNGGMQGLAAWAVATVLVVAATGLATTSTANVLSNLAGPSASLRLQMEQVAGARTDRATTGQAAQPTPAPAANVQTQVATAMLASFVALVLGAIAAFFGGRMAENRSSI